MAGDAERLQIRWVIGAASYSWYDVVDLCEPMRQMTEVLTTVLAMMAIAFDRSRPDLRPYIFLELVWNTAWEDILSRPFFLPSGSELEGPFHALSHLA